LGTIFCPRHPLPFSEKGNKFIFLLVFEKKSTDLVKFSFFFLFFLLLLLIVC